MTKPYLPPVLYRVTRVGGVYSHAETGGKTYADIKHAKAYRSWLTNRGAEAKIYICYPEWNELPDE